MNNFKYALTLANLLYDIDITNEEDAIEIGLIAYNHIGNKKTRLNQITVPVINGVVQLPCEIDLVEAITYPGSEDWNNTSNIHKFGDTNSYHVENYIEGNKQFENPLYNSGKLVKYRQTGNNIYIDDYCGNVNILYHTQLTDEDGLPELNDKEAVAIADYIAYVTKYKEGIRTNNPANVQLAASIYTSWMKHCNAARTPIYLSQNDMNNILDAQSSFDRKLYGKSYKPVK